MKTYVVNLERSTDRKEYMQQLLQPYTDVLDVEFIEAVDGRLLNGEEKEQSFNVKRAFKRYGREIKPGEIGCTLSHQKCYQKLINSSYDYVFILEDDVVFRQDIKQILPLLEKSIQTDEPMVILLSGGHWFLKKTLLSINYKLASVYDAYYTHAYLINRAAAIICSENKPCFLADDWKYFLSKGVKIKACTPHLINQLANEECSSLIFDNGEGRGMLKKNMNFLRSLQMYWIGGVKRILKQLKCYENVY